jgi:hypothetical protein
MEKVQIFQSCRRFSIGRVYISGDTGSFQFINSENLFFFPKFEGVAHQDQINWVVVFHTNLINAVNTCKHRVRVFFEVLVDTRQYFLKKLEFLITHSFYNESLIMTKEEEGT